jgi:nicotinate-nucleotide adenylyltransferase
MSNFVIDILAPKTNLKLKIGLFFGSFNPVHIGHMAIANYMVEFAGLDQVWFVVTPQNPHKQNQNLLNEYARLEMVNLAIGDDNRFRASDVEFRLPKPSYTINTLAVLTEKYPDYHFSIIIGSDNLESLPKWKNYETLTENYGIIIYPRPGFKAENKPSGKNYIFTEAPLMEISSSFIRNAIREGKNIRHFLPAGVFDHLDKMNYYKY